VEFQLALTEIVQKQGKGVFFDVRQLKGLLMDTGVEKKHITQITAFLETGHLKQIIENTPTQINTITYNQLIDNIHKDTEYQHEIITNILTCILTAMGIGNKSHSEPKKYEPTIFSTPENTLRPLKSEYATMKTLLDKLLRQESTQTSPQTNNNTTKILTKEEAKKLSGPYIIIPLGYTKIDNNAFEKRRDIVRVIIPNFVTYIGNYAFEYCRNLKSIILPDSVTTIGSDTFFGCHRLVISCSINSYAHNYCLKNNIPLYKKKQKTSTIKNKNPTTIYNSVIIPNNFNTTHTDNHITIPYGSTEIDNYAYAYSKRLTSVTIPASVKTIGYHAFNFCENLTMVTISNSVTTINNYAFSGCRNLTHITIPDSVTAIDKNAFLGCDKLAVSCSKNSYAHQYCLKNNIRVQVM
jgi:hypothetical protein